MFLCIYSICVSISPLPFYFLLVSKSIYINLYIFLFLNLPVIIYIYIFEYFPVLLISDWIDTSNYVNFVLLDCIVCWSFHSLAHWFYFLQR